MNQHLLQLKSSVDNKIGARSSLRKQLKEAKSTLKSLRVIEKHTSEARNIIQIVAHATQQELQYKVSELATLALKAVFHEQYTLHVDFLPKRGKSEAYITVQKADGEKVDPMASVGGSVVDIAAFALRITLWSLNEPRTRPVIILDEPFRNVSKDYQRKAGQLITELSRKLGLQFIIITHEEEVAQTADRIFKVSISKGISKVEQEDTHEQ